MSKKIAIDLRVAFHEKRGIPRYVLNFAKTLSKFDLQNLMIFFLIPVNHREDARTLPPFKENAKVIFLEEKSIWHWEQILLPGWCRKNGIDLLQLFTNRGPIFNRGVREIHVVHDTIAIHEANWEKGIIQGLLGLFYNFISIRASARTSSHLITDSNFSKEVILKELKIPPSKLSVVYIGVESIFFNPPELDRSKMPIPEGPYLFHLGSFDPRKNTQRVLQAYAALPKTTRTDFPLVIAGLSQKAKEKFIPLINSYGIDKNVVILPFVSDEDLAALYKNCFVFIWPSCWEGFGLPVLEAMAAGAPVLTARATSIPEISGGCALLFDPFDIEEITEGITTLISDDKLRAELKQKGRQWAQSFTWENTVLETLKIWKALLES